MKIKKNINKGVAIILTISALTAISVLGMSFLALLNMDQKHSADLMESLAGESAIESALNISIFEIQNRLLNNANYIYSVIESGNPANAGIPDSYLYFKSIIKTTNSKLCIYQNMPEFNNVFPKIKNKLGLTASNQIDFDSIHTELKKDVYRKWDIKRLSEITKIYIAGIGDATKMKVYTSLLKHITTYPLNKDKELSVNIIDYGKSAASATATEFTATAREFSPTGDLNHLNGSKLKIIAGPGLNEVRTIIGIDSTDHAKLLLDTTESWTVTPTVNSFYRIYSYVSPINFNAASKELIEANFEVISTLCTQRIAGISLGSYSSVATNTILGKLFNLRETQKILIKDFSDFLQNYIESLSGYNSNLKNKMEIQRIFDLKQPKAYYNNTTSLYEIYPIPVPFCFESNGYFDVEVTAGMKKNPKSAKASNTLKRYATLKVNGKYEQSLREDFYNVNAQTFMTPTDWVPVTLLDDPATWTPTSNTNFKPYWDFIAPNNNTTPNVIPDSLKNGIWLDFKADSEGRGDDKIIYSTVPNDFLNGSQLQNLFNPISGTVALNAGTLQIQGNASPQSKVLLQTGIEDDFGDVSIMTEMQDNNVAQVFRMSHPAYDILWYNAPIANHIFSDHTNNTIGIDGLAHYTYPAERYFSPSLYIYDVVGNADITYQPEYGYDDPGDYDSYGATCTTPDASYTGQDSFSVIFGDEPNVNLGSGHFNSNNPNNFSVYLHTFKLYTIIDPIYSKIDVSVFDPSNITTIYAKDDNFRNTVPSLLDSATPTLSNSNKIGFRRRFLPGYYDGSGAVNGQFSVKYLRVIPISNGATTYPNYTTNPIAFPNNTKKISRIKVYYRIGLTEKIDFTSSTWDSTKDIKFKFTGDSLCKYIDKGGNNQSFTQIFQAGGTPEITIDSFDKVSGYKIIDATSLPLIPNGSTNVTFEYTLKLEGDTSTLAFTTAFLKSTIAIEKVEIIYELDDNILSVFENN